MYDNELYHYGVKGMKWGIRKRKNKTDVTRVSRRKLMKQEKSKRESRQ